MSSSMPPPAMSGVNLMRPAPGAPMPVPAVSTVTGATISAEPADWLLKSSGTPSDPRPESGGMERDSIEPPGTSIVTTFARSRSLKATLAPGLTELLESVIVPFGLSTGSSR